MGRVANYLVTFAVSIILTRILEPAEFGAYGIILGVSVFAWVILEFGFRSAVVQAAEVSRTQLSTVFFVNLALGAGLSVCVALAGPIFERFFAIPGLSIYLIGASPLFVLNALMVVPSGLLQKQLKLKQVSLLSVASAIVGGVVAVGMAKYGFGVWSLIVSNLLGAVTTVTASFAIARWKPSLDFDLASIRSLFAFGSRIFLASILDVVFTRADVFVIGKLFNAATLGFYSRAQSIDQQVRMFSVSTIVTVMLPVFSANQGEVENLRKIYLRSLHFISFTTISLAGLLFLTADELFNLLFTEKWAIAAGFFKIMAISSSVYPLNYLMLNLISGRGNSSSLLRLEILKKAILTPTYLSFIVGGIYTFLVAFSAANIISLVITMAAVAKEIELPVSRQLQVLGTYVLMTALSVLLAYGGLSFLGGSGPVHLIGLTVVFTAVYLALNWWFRTVGSGEFFGKGLEVLGRKNISAA